MLKFILLIYVFNIEILLLELFNAYELRKFSQDL